MKQIISILVFILIVNIVNSKQSNADLKLTTKKMKIVPFFDKLITNGVNLFSNNMKENDSIITYKDIKLLRLLIQLNYIRQRVSDIVEKKEERRKARKKPIPYWFPRLG